MLHTANGEFEIKMSSITGSELEKILRAGATDNVCRVNIHNAHFEDSYLAVLFDATFTIRTAGQGSKKKTAAILRAMNIIPE